MFLVFVVFQSVAPVTHMDRNVQSVLERKTDLVKAMETVM